MAPRNRGGTTDRRSQRTQRLLKARNLWLARAAAPRILDCLRTGFDSFGARRTSTRAMRGNGSPLDSALQLAGAGSCTVTTPDSAAGAAKSDLVASGEFNSAPGTLVAAAGPVAPRRVVSDQGLGAGSGQAAPSGGRTPRSGSDDAGADRSRRALDLHEGSLDAIIESPPRRHRANERSRSSSVGGESPRSGAAQSVSAAVEDS